ncbi:hypothetical protein N0O92_10590 [Alkalihalobacillus sp. MEB130]|uniref:hypothetical protein n=1 Tax=Alkalihalobacillus sp. MEB130 TaxID=2976704 RepID=UPI0028DD5D94|nr:hypothetical protein [Alkalihalobacillus sp. MEB130]MDT8860681.1 hypothetical protein [Alkalihalobacillus sp. MEB130]
MDEFKQKQMEQDLKIKELEAKIETLRMANDQQIKQTDIQEMIDLIISEKEIALEQEVEKKMNQQQLQLIKWAAGTGISVIAVVISIFRIFFM